MKHKSIVLLFLFIISAGWLYGQADNCYSIVAGQNATADGSVLFGHNEDDRGPYHVSVLKIASQELAKFDAFAPGHGHLPPLLQRSIPLLWLHIPEVEFGDSFFNERGVVIASDACPSREDKGELSNGGIGNALRRLVAERARTAREAVLLAGELIQAYGYSSSGRSYIIADAHEGWVLHAVKGKHWVARRVPDDEVALIANTYTIGEVNLNDTANFLGSPDLVEYAQKRGWYHPGKDGPFVFNRAYADPAAGQGMYNIMRQWRGINILAEKEIPLDTPLPFSIKPRRKMHMSDFFKVLRDHYEGTEQDLTERYKSGSPNSTQNRTICTESTQYSFVAHLRGWLPAEIGGMAWIAFRRPDSNGYSPWYFSIHTPPQGYTLPEADGGAALVAVPESVDGAFASFAKVSDLVDSQYRDRIETAQKVWRNFENYAFKDQKNREKEFEYMLKIHRVVSLHLITNYVHFLEYRKWLLAVDLLRELKNR